MPLLWYLRDEVGLTGSSSAAARRSAAPATIHLGGTAVRSCVTPVSEAEGKEVVTIEGLSPDGNHPVQVAWRDQNVAQCGYCQCGQIMQAASLLKDTPKPTDAQIDDRHERQHLPMRHLSAHPHRHPPGAGQTAAPKGERL